jgi:hypothetical protein
VISLPSLHHRSDAAGSDVQKEPPMKRPPILLTGCVLLAVAGCQSSQFPGDPFLGRQRVPPPGTGAVVPATVGQPYYQTQPPIVQPGAMTPISPAPVGVAPYNGPYGAPQSSAPTSPAVTPAAGGLLTGRPALAGGSPSAPSSQVAINLDEPSPTSPARPANLAAPTIAATSPASRSTESTIAIVEPDFVAARAAESNQPSAANNTGVVHAAATMAPEDFGRVVLVSGQAVAAPDEPQRAPERFAHANDYSRLQGRLEHLASRNEWKLRYIPIDGDTDQYGGSVVIANPDQLGSLAAGEFVVVEGQLEPAASDSLSYAPPFRVARASANSR